MAWAPLVGAAGGVAGLAAAARPWDGHPLSLALARITVAVVALGAGFALEDPARSTLACSPTTLRWRQSVRLGLAAVAAGAVAATAGLTVATVAGRADLPVGRMLLEASGLLLLALALSTALGADRGPFVFTAALFGAVLVQQSRPELSLFPMAPGAPGWSGAVVAWAALAAASAAALLVLSRDPCARTWRPHAGRAH